MNFNELRKIIDKYKDKILINSKTPWQFNQNKLLFKEINIKYKNTFKNVMEIVYLIKNYNNLENLHIFCYCGNKNNFGNIYNGYAKYCSNKCMANNKQYQEKIKNVRLNNVDENGLNSYQRAIKKGKITKKEKYGNENYNNSKKMINTKRNKIDENGLNGFQRGYLTKKNTIDENGLNLLQKISIKIKNTRLNDVDKNGLNSYQRAARKTVNTMKCIINEDGFNGLQVAARKAVKTKKNNIDENGLNGIQRAAIKGVQTAKNNIDENGLNSLQRAAIKNIQTKKKNNSFNKSIQEEQVYQLLLQKFNKNDIIRQYRSTLYPFNCDFYIKSLDLYIEYHGTWTHGNKPFKHSVEDLEKLKRLKNKNKLNYKIFYNIEQFKNWFGKI